MSGTIISFPKVKRRPNTVEVQFDLGEWTIAYFQNRRFVSRLDFRSKAAAEAEARRLAEGGMIWRRGDNGTVYIIPCSLDGGYWAVAHRSKSEGSDALLGRYFSLDDAVSYSIRAAEDMGAEVCLTASDGNGGAA
jgi:hypothetical protein